MGPRRYLWPDVPAPGDSTWIASRRFSSTDLSYSTYSGRLRPSGIWLSQGNAGSSLLPNTRVRSRAGKAPRAVADYDLAHSPQFQMLLVPGGIGTRREVENRPVLDFIRSRSAEAEVVMSVCTGAGLLARAGLLDGRRATTNKQVFEWPVSQGPRVNWVRQARWVEDGKFVTSSGISEGIDMALAVIGRRYGGDAARGNRGRDGVRMAS